MIAYTTELNENNYTYFTSDGLVLVFILASWCTLCNIASPIVDEISSEYFERIKIGKLDIETYTPDVKFRDIPSFVIYKDGNVLDILTGFEDKEKFIEFFNKYL